jgi:DNA-binding MarR family transcriptional regulator
MTTMAPEIARTAARTALSLSPRLSRWVQTRVQEDEESDLSLRQLTTLQYIDSPDTTLGDVARNLMVTPAVVTGLIDRLERRGYVRRVGSLFDRRRVHLELTTAGEDARDHAENRLASDLERYIGELSNDEVERLNDGLSLLNTVLTRLEQERKAPTR